MSSIRVNRSSMCSFLKYQIRKWSNCLCSRQINSKDIIPTCLYNFYLNIFNWYFYTLKKETRITGFHLPISHKSSSNIYSKNQLWMLSFIASIIIYLILSWGLNILDGLHVADKLHHYLSNVERAESEFSITVSTQREFLQLLLNNLSWYQE